MMNQMEKKEKIYSKVFTPENILRARQVYEYFTDKYLLELNVALQNGDSRKASELKNRLNLISKNLLELKDVEVPVFSYGEVVHLTAPARRKDVEKRMAIKKEVFTEKNVKTALNYYHSYIDVFLDNLNTALKNGDLVRVEELKVELESLQKNINDLKGVVTF